jgi:hypothetical protein
MKELKKQLKLVVVDKLPPIIGVMESRYRKIVEEFHRMKAPFAKVEGISQTTPLIYVIRKLNLNNEVWATRRKKEVFLVNSKVSGLLKTYRKKLYGTTSKDKTKITDLIKEQPRPAIKKQR